MNVLKSFWIGAGAIVIMTAASCTKDEPTGPNTTGTMPTAGLLAQYQFSGDAQDASGNGYHGTPKNGVEFVSGRSAAAGKAARFNGLDAQVDVLNSEGSKLEMDTAFTFSLWLNGTSSMGGSGFSHLITKAAPFGNGYYLKWNHDNNSKLGLYLVRAASGTSTPYDYLGIGNAEFVGSWHHIVYTWSRGSAMIALYVDGVLRQTVNNAKWDASHSGTLQLGGFNSGTPGASFPGLMDDVRIYNRVLSAAEIGTLSGEHK
jgi:hypothetical protein